jgi:hypothetical protein
VKGQSGVTKGRRAKPGYAIRTGLFIEPEGGKRLELLTCNEGSWFEKAGTTRTRCRGIYADQQSDLRVPCDRDSPIHLVISLEEAFSMGRLGRRQGEGVTVTIESLQAVFGIYPPQARRAS